MSRIDFGVAKTTAESRLHPSNMSAVRQEFIQRCQDLIFISLRRDGGHAIRAVRWHVSPVGNTHALAPQWTRLHAIVRPSPIALT
jgi:hypothetical protein